MNKLCNTVIANKYKLGQPIGRGAFGVVYLGMNIENGDQVAVKVEKCTSHRQYLPNESEMYACLSGGIGIPRLHYSGVEQGMNVLVLQLLGPTLEQLFNSCGRNFSMKTILLLGNQMINRLEYLHMNHVIYRDVKPENFVMGLGKDKATLYLIDFGLVKSYSDTRTTKHIEYRDDYDLIGTPRYASINAHMGIEQSRRDDMESIGYTLIYFYLGSLPWQGIMGVGKKQQYERIFEKKMSVSLEELCRNAPLEFLLYMYYCRSLHFVEQPNYNYLRELFDCLYDGLNFSYDNIFDWHCNAEEDDEEEEENEKDKKENSLKDNDNDDNDDDDDDKLEIIDITSENMNMPALATCYKKKSHTIEL